MQYDCDWPSRKAVEKHTKWRKWFAWYPVRLEDHDCRWLETVWRLGTWDQGSYADDPGWRFEYQPIINVENT